jgi:hypothetical protein
MNVLNIHQHWELETNSILTLPFYEVSNPNMVINLLCRSFSNAFVSTSATMFSVEQYSKVIFPFSTRSQTK